MSDGLTTSLPLRGRAVIVTGGAAGIGAAIVDACLSAGARVLSADLAPTPSREGVVGVVADVASTAGRHAIIDACLTAFGAVDGLVNNAGVNFSKPFLATTEADWDAVLNVDLKAVFFLTQLAVAWATAAGRGLSVVNISSVHATAACPGAGPYDAAKAGVLSLTRALAVELGAVVPPIRVNAVSPGLVATGIWEDLLAAAENRAACEEYWMSQVPQRRTVLPAEVAGPVAFLLSSAAGAITGANLVVDGGMTARLLSTPAFASAPIGGAEPAAAAVDFRGGESVSDG